MTHSRAPRFHGPLAGARTRTGLNPLCGDEVVIYLAGDRQAISSRFESKGCALCKASASILMAEVQGQPATAALQSTLAFVRTFEHGPWSSSLSEDLQALADLRRFASRTKCVLLPWQTLAELLQEDQ